MKANLPARALVVAILAVLCGPWASSAFAGGKVAEYAADMMEIGSGGKVESVGRIYVAPGKWRMESRDPEADDMAAIVIIRQDKKVQWMLLPDEKAYMEMAISEQEARELVGKTAPGTTVKEKDLGLETVNGYACRKKEIESESTVMGQVVKERSIVWISEDFDFPLRTLDEGGGVTEMRNIKKGAQPASLFEIPPGYKKMNGVGTMPGGGGSSVAPGLGGDAGVLPLPGGLKIPGL